MAKATDEKAKEHAGQPPTQATDNPNAPKAGELTPPANPPQPPKMAGPSVPDPGTRDQPQGTRANVPAQGTGPEGTTRDIKEEQANPKRHEAETDQTMPAGPPLTADEEGKAVDFARKKGGNVFRLLGLVSGMGQPIGTPVSEFDFPAGTDFDRLMRLGAIEPVGDLRAVRRSPVPREHMDALEQMHDAHTELADASDRRFAALERRVSDLEAAFAKS
jgi:hypothetical protein